MIYGSGGDSDMLRKLRGVLVILTVVGLLPGEPAFARPAAGPGWNSAAERLDGCLSRGSSFLDEKEILLKEMLARGAPVEVYDYLEDDPFETVRPQLIELYNIATLLPRAPYFDKIVSTALQELEEYFATRQNRVVYRHLTTVARDLRQETEQLAQQIDELHERWKLMDANYPARQGEDRDRGFRQRIRLRSDERECLLRIRRSVEIELHLLRSALETFLRLEGLANEDESARPNVDRDHTTVFLLDTSESMKMEGRMAKAKEAALKALDRLEAGREAAEEVRVALYVFGGTCSEPGVREVVGWTSDLEGAREVLQEQAFSPRGKTPLPQAISALAAHMKTLSTGREAFTNVVLLSDGESTCGPLRPAGTYLGGANTGKARLHGSHDMRFLTVGLDLAPGSPAERDLMYLARQSQGRYLQAANQRQLERAFERFTRTYELKPLPTSQSLSASLATTYSEGVQAAQANDFATARSLFSTFLEDRSDIPAAHYNYALALEATDRYLQAADHLERYLALAPEAPDREDIEREISLLRQDHVDHRAHQVAILRSDLEYLEDYYQSLFNRSNADLAMELGGFLREKQELYENLPERIGVEEPWLERATESLAAGFERIAGRLGTTSFDRDAVSLLAVPVSQLEDIVERLEQGR